ncbi:MAG: cytochrome c biogenesis protein ResB [Nitrospirae bacterium]|nr:cytochrome c biogenesis protein ResB [Nitrospirota bacterium]
MKVNQTGSRIKQKGFVLKIFDVFASIKLAVAIFFLLALGSIIGTVIEQGLSPEEYLAKFGERQAYWINLLKLNDTYHSWWFTSLLALLAINLSVCVAKRVPVIMKSYRFADLDFTHNLVTNLRNSTIIQYSGNIEDAKAKVISVLSGRKYKIITENTPKGISIVAAKGRIGRLGAIISHISIFIILMGAVLSSAIGYRSFYPFYEHEPVYVPQGNFYLQMDKFWIDYYDTGMIKDYFSTMTVIDHGKKVLTKTIQVNDPLQYKGVWFYQSSYGMAWDRIDKAFIKITDKKTGNIVAEDVLDFRKEKEIKGTDLRINATNFLSHFAYDSQSNQIYSKSPEHENPAVQLDIYEGGKLISTPWIFYKYPNMFPVKNSKYNFILAGYNAPQYSGLQIAKDPGVNLVWVGSFMLMIGLFISFFVFHRRLWVKVVSSENNTLIYIGGLTNKDFIGFEKEMKVITESF